MLPNRTLARLVAAVFFVIYAMVGVMAASDALVGSEWRPIELTGETVPADAGLFVRFEAEQRVAGHGGCNALFGRYTIDTVNLAIGPLAATRKACPPEIMKREAALLKALENTRLFLRDGVKLTLKDAQGLTVLRLAQSDWD